MLSATNHDTPAFHTRSSTAQCNITEYLTLQPTTDTVMPDITKVTDPLTEDKLQALPQMQRTDPFCKCISKHLSNGKAPKHEADLFLYVKGLLHKPVTDSHQKFLALVIPKTWKYTVLLKGHDKLGYQGAIYTYYLINHQYY